ncbi:MAG: ASKHA domain-containing protein [Candidatus Latescibacterota bacterium]
MSDTPTGNRFEVVFEPEGKAVQAPQGATILEIARSEGIPIEGPCGGDGTCGKCRVLALGSLSECSDAEKKHLSEEDRARGIRLACRARVNSRTRVEVPRTTRLIAQRILDSGTGRAVPLDSATKAYSLALPKPTLEDQRTDFERIKQTHPFQRELWGRLPLLRALPRILRENDFQITAVCSDGELIHIRGGSDAAPLYGVAFDIGTTTVVGYLIDLSTGEQIGVSAAMNPQVVYGDDVIARLSFVIEDKDGLGKLHRAIIGAINEITETLAEKAGILKTDIYEMTIVGNTCMHHLFLNIDPSQLAPSPFVPVISEPIWVHAEELDLAVYPQAHVHILPNISGYVGTDIIGGILASGIYDTPDNVLLVDIGTNGEIVFSAGGKMVACATAAGPAFEGARISCGMRGAPGAIDQVVFDEDVSYTTIGNDRPRGLCGSGLLDVVAEMVRVGVVDSSGRIVDPEDANPSLPDRIRARIRAGETGNDFLLVPPEEGEDGHAMYITSRDVRELQLSKSAIRSGIDILMAEMGVPPSGLSRILLAGAFGNYLRKESASAIGLLPPISVEKIHSIGNAAGEGAKLALISQKERKRAAVLARQIQYIELSTRMDFMEKFTDNMFFDA